MDNFEIIKEVGKGAFATVFKVKRKSDGEICALKRVKVMKMNQRDKENALNEIRMMASVIHPNIIGYKEAFYHEESETLNIIMEFAEEGDMSRKIKICKTNKTYMNETLIWNYFLQILHGLKALHDKKIIHRDLKSANVFICSNGKIKIGDFNVSKVLKMNFLTTQTGTPYYASPEVWKERPYDFKSDIWSLGCILYEICALRVPFRAQTINLLCTAVTKGVYDPLPSGYSKELSQVLALLLAIDQKKRPNCDSLLANPILVQKMEKVGFSITESRGVLLDTLKWPQKIEALNSLLPNYKKIADKGITHTSEKGNQIVENDQKRTPSTRKRGKTPIGCNNPFTIKIDKCRILNTPVVIKKSPLNIRIKLFTPKRALIDLQPKKPMNINIKQKSQNNDNNNLGNRSTRSNSPNPGHMKILNIIKQVNISIDNKMNNISHLSTNSQANINNLQGSNNNNKNCVVITSDKNVADNLLKSKPMEKEIVCSSNNKLNLNLLCINSNVVQKDKPLINIGNVGNNNNNDSNYLYNKMYKNF